jgi:TRAP transporter TAXI family solute receptor
MSADLTDLYDDRPMADRDEGPLETTKRRRRAWLIATVLVAVIAAVVFVSGPSPPREIRLATGQPGGMYDRFGLAYATRLGRIGLHTERRTSAGSLDNLQRLLRGEVDVAFVQGGTYPLVADPERRLRGIAAIYFEPLWLFHRPPAVRTLSDLEGRRLSIGLPESGTEAVATALLRVHGIEATGPHVERATNAMAAQRLEQGSLDALFMVSAYGDPLIHELAGRPGISLMSFQREMAYARTFPALTPVKLHEGMLDLRRNLPARDVTLLAPAALVVSRAELHPRVVEEILKVAQAIHGPGTLLDPPLRFPSLEGLDVPPHEAAGVYLTHGESFLSRSLPYAVLRWTLLVRVLVISLVLWIPLVRFLPEIGKWRMDRRFSRLYAGLRDVDRRLTAARDTGELSAGLAELDRVCHEAHDLCDRMPAGRQRDVYDWRMHVSFVRAQAMERLAALSAEKSPSTPA